MLLNKNKVRNKARCLKIAIYSLFFIFPSQVYASDIFSKAKEMMLDIYKKILGISTAAAVVSAAVSLFFMFFGKSSRQVDEGREWLKRIVIVWIILNSLGLIVTYLTPLISGGEFSG